MNMLASVFEENRVMVQSSAKARQAIARMDAPLRKYYEALRQALAEDTGRDVWDRYRIGQLIADVKASELPYGRGAVPELASALGMNEGTLYRYALVAETWGERELKSLLARKTPLGEPLSFSHFVELAQVPDKKMRDDLLAHAFAHGVSVRELIDAIAEARSQKAIRGRGVPADTLLRQVAATCDAVQRKLEISERLLSNLEKSRPSSDTSTQELLADAIAKQRAVLAASTRALEKLERARKKLAPAREKAPVSRVTRKAAVRSAGASAR